MSQVRRIITTYSFKRREKKITRSVHANKAVTNAVEHMRLNDYAASVAQVSCSETVNCTRSSRAIWPAASVMTTMLGSV